MSKCYFYTVGGCKVTTSKSCEGCNFYKTHTQVEISRKALRRLKTLDKPIRLNIAEKYKVEGIV